MYDAAVAIGFAPRTSLSQMSNLRDSDGYWVTTGPAPRGAPLTRLAYGFGRKSEMQRGKCFYF
jgi:hypothetical protein